MSYVTKVMVDTANQNRIMTFCWIFKATDRCSKNGNVKFLVFVFCTYIFFYILSSVPWASIIPKPQAVAINYCPISFPILRIFSFKFVAVCYCWEAKFRFVPAPVWVVVSSVGPLFVTGYGCYRLRKQYRFLANKWPNKVLRRARSGVRGAGGGFYARRWASFNTLWELWDGCGVPLFPGRAPYLAIVSLRLGGPQFQVPGLGLCLLAAWQGAAAERASGMAQALCGPLPLSAV